MEKIRKDTKNKTLGWRAGTLHKMEVWKNGIIVGNGYVISYPNGRLEEPMLFSFTGNPLPQDWYQLNMIEYQLCIVSRSIH